MIQLDAHVDAYRIHCAVRRRLTYELEPYTDMEWLSTAMWLDCGCIAGRVTKAATQAADGWAALPDPDAPDWDFSYLEEGETE